MPQSTVHPSVTAAVEAVARGFTPIPIKDRDKRPHLSAWTRTSWEGVTPDQVAERFEGWAEEGAGNVGVLLGEPGGGLVDVDLDHPKTARLKDYFLPRTLMRSGRAGRPSSHYWYRVTGDMPGTRRYKMPEQDDGRQGAVSVELRANLTQTVIPPSVHPSGEDYAWVALPWGGDTGPAEIDGRKLAVQVALLGLGTVLIDRWPTTGSRHDAYLALAGGLLRFGENGIHPFWERNAPVVISALASATLDDDGPDQRVKEVMGTTLGRLRRGSEAVGFTRLAEYIGEKHATQVRRMVDEVEALAGFQSRNAPSPEVAVASPSSAPVSTAADTGSLQEESAARDSERAASRERGEERNGLDDRVGSWEPVDLDPYLQGQIRVVEPSVLRRADGQALMYPGRVNMLYGSSESAKSWIALNTCLQEMALGERVLYLDFEDEPVNTLSRLRALGAGDDEVRLQFAYVRPEKPLAPMQRNRWGQVQVSPEGQRNEEHFLAALRDRDPSLIIADGMTVLYGLHGLDSNDAVSTDVITGWLKSLTDNGRRTVIIIDHTGKGSEKGSLPIGSQHKVSMVQGSMLQVWPIRQPMPGAIGEVELVVLKDRPGLVRAVSQKSGTKAQTAAVVTMDSTVTGVTVMTIASPDTTPLAGGVGAPSPADVKRTEAERHSRERDAMRDEILALFGGDLDRWLAKKEIMAALVPGWIKGSSMAGTRAAAQKVDDRDTLRRMDLIEMTITHMSEGSGVEYLRTEGETQRKRFALTLGEEIAIDLSNAGDPASAE